MRIATRKKNGNAGNILALTLIVATVLAIALTSFLFLTNVRSHSVARSQLWNESLTVAEAGIEDGLAYINKYVGQQNMTNWINTYAEDNWQYSNNVFWVTRYMDTAKTRYYTVYVTNTAVNPMIRSTGYVPNSSWAGTGRPLSRTILIGTKTKQYFNAAMAALGTIDLKGNNIATDSFDSSATNWPGYWTNTIRSAFGDVVTDNQITNSTLNAGNANIAGHVKTGPTGTLLYNANVSIGDLPWVDASTPGIEPGYYANDLNVTFDDVVVPNVSWMPVTSLGGLGGSGTAPDGKTYAHIFTKAANGGFYTLKDSGDIYVDTNVMVTVQVLNSVGTFAPQNLFVAGTGANSGKFVAYCDCPSVWLGTGDEPQSAVAGNMVFLGTPNCTALKYNGNGDFTGAMYMPEAVFTLVGGGSGVLDFVGSSVTQRVQMNGHYHFHYDLALKTWSPNNAYVAAAWREL